MYIKLKIKNNWTVLMEKLPNVFGIQSFSPVAICDKDIGSNEIISHRNYG